MAYDDRIIDNYIYLYHTDTWVYLPVYPDSIADSMKVSFQETNALSRTAPVLSYNNSGPRTVQINLSLHRDMFDDANIGYSNLKVEIGDDYVDTMIKQLQSIALPRYQATSKSVVPPMVAVRFGDDIFVKGVVNSQISVTYKKPVLSNGKYALVDVAFTITESDPYDADSVSQAGSFRGITRTFKNGIKEAD
jgi:hypothetical protein